MEKNIYIEIIGYGYGNSLLYYCIIKNYKQIYQILKNFIHRGLGYPVNNKFNDNIDECDVIRMQNYIETLQNIKNIKQLKNIEMMDTDPGFEIVKVKYVEPNYNNLQICKLYCEEDLIY